MLMRVATKWHLQAQPPIVNERFIFKPRQVGALVQQVISKTVTPASSLASLKSGCRRCQAYLKHALSTQQTQTLREKQSKKLTSVQKEARLLRFKRYHNHAESVISYKVTQGNSQ
eukprot:GILJ01023900.1.p1 GENE.GILJ01023900.1~~GILJ01023900.1.p1  ORF type:complete len:115 (+),score=6.83 GILJ01023900.1:478-822(+)